MFKEFSIEPDVIVGWIKKDLGTFIERIENFMFAKQLRLTEYPYKKSDIRKYIIEQIKDSLSDVELSYALDYFKPGGDLDGSFLGNHEAVATPFNKKYDQLSDKFLGKDIDRVLIDGVTKDPFENEKLFFISKDWRADKESLSVDIPVSATERLIDQFKKLTSISKEVVIVETYFSPKYNKFKLFFKQLLSYVFSCGWIESVCVISGHPDAVHKGKKSSEIDLGSEEKPFLNYIRGFENINVKEISMVRVLEEKQTAKKELHDRFFLTDQGGLSLGEGFGIDKKQQNVNVTIDVVSNRKYMDLWDIYKRGDLDRSFMFDEYLNVNGDFKYAGRVGV